MATVSTKAVIEDNFSPTIVKWQKEVQGVEQAVNGLNHVMDDQTKIVNSQAAAINKNREALREAARAEEEAKNIKRASRDETQKLSDALADSIVRLRAQKELLQDPVFSQNLKYQQNLRSEIDQMTRAITGAEIAQKAENEAVQLTVRSRRELIVLAHELSQGQYKNFGGSLMVLEEGQGGILGAVKAATAMLGGPYVVAAGAAALATTAVGAALWKASEHAAEHYHKMSQIGQTYGASAQTMMGFEQLTIGTGISVAQLGESFSRFTTNLSTHRQELERVGITARDPVQAFEQLMDVAQRTQDPIARSSILTQALGEEWRKLAPLLMKGGDAAREAIKEMAIPEDVQENYKRAAEAQIEIDKNFSLIGKHAGEAMSGIRAWFKEFESGISRVIAKAGDQDFRYALRHMGFVERQEREDAPSKNPTDFYSTFGSGLTKEQQTALDDTAKRVSKESLTAELAQVRKEFEEKASLFEKNSAEYRTIMERELQAEAEVRKKWAKKGAGARGPSESQIEANVVRNFDGSVTMRSGLEYEANPDAEHLRNRETAERTDDKSAAKKAADAKRQAEIDKKLMEDVMKYANAYHRGMEDLQDKETEKLKRENDKRIQEERRYWQAMESAAESSINSTLQTLIMGGGSMKSKLDALLTQGESSLISSGVSMLMGAAFAPATGGTSLAVPAGMEFLTSIMGVRRASGGQVFGGFIGNEGARGGAEYVVPNAPSRVYNSTQQTTNNLGGITIAVQGGGSAHATVKALERAMPRILRNSTANRGQNSRSGG